jgi:hypothetical protein
LHFFSTTEPTTTTSETECFGLALFFYYRTNELAERHYGGDDDYRPLKLYQNPITREFRTWNTMIRRIQRARQEIWTAFPEAFTDFTPLRHLLPVHAELAVIFDNEEQPGIIIPSYQPPSADPDDFYDYEGLLLQTFDGHHLLVDVLSSERLENYEVSTFYFPFMNLKNEPIVWFLRAYNHAFSYRCTDSVQAIFSPCTAELQLPRPEDTLPELRHLRTCLTFVVNKVHQHRTIMNLAPPEKRTLSAAMENFSQAALVIMLRQLVAVMGLPRQALAVENTEYSMYAFCLLSAYALLVGGRFGPGPTCVFSERRQQRTEVAQTLRACVVFLMQYFSQLAVNSLGGQRNSKTQFFQTVGLFRTGFFVLSLVTNSRFTEIANPRYDNVLKNCTVVYNLSKGVEEMWQTDNPKPIYDRWRPKFDSDRAARALLVLDSADGFIREFFQAFDHAMQYLDAHALPG